VARSNAVMQTARTNKRRLRVYIANLLIRLCWVTKRGTVQIG
jgi:hypothetical protein